MSNRTRLVGALGVAVIMTMGCSGTPSTQVASSPAARASSRGGLSLVVIGDSIPDTRQEECPGCTGFVTQYANALSKATGRPVTTVNKSEQTNLTLPGLLGKLPDLKGQLSTADAIIVGIAHNSIPLNDSVPCGSSFDPHTVTMGDWSKINPACADEATKKYGPLYDQLYSTSAGWRQGHPTILLTINKYNDWVGATAVHLTADQADRTVCPSRSSGDASPRSATSERASQPPSHPQDAGNASASGWRISAMVSAVRGPSAWSLGQRPVASTLPSVQPPRHDIRAPGGDQPEP